MSSKRHRPARRTGGRRSGHPPGSAQPRRLAENGQPPAEEYPDTAGHPTVEGERAVLEQWSAPLLVRLSALPAWLAPAIMLVLTLTGLLVGGVVGFVLLLVTALFLGWLAALSWPLLRPRARLLRALVPLAVLAAAILQLL